ncbi:MAG: NAD(P)/FAD-dependent oxidoreductase [Deltaproteobacteria bacterium]|nr:NAD(P)/FAD-dependent oxidoreductase [Deltaproteobacteria bacterium]
MGFDAEALRAKYRAEREKRLRADGIAQYVEAKGRFARFEEDPFSAPITRAPLTDEIDVALIGGGFGGLLAGVRLRQRGVQRLRLIEKGGDVGGTWYWNRYPGVACDIESYVYLPLLEELGYVPKEKYSRGEEIYAHCQAIARKFDLYRDICLQTEVTELRWDAADARWVVRTNRGDAMRARFVVLSNGYLQKPKLPGIPGLEEFAGHCFHTSRWDYAYTGGDASGNLEGLRDKRVGIVGTGATAVQCIPHLGASAQHLFVFQRTPSSVDVRANRPTDPAWAAALAPGWHQQRVANFQILTAGGFQPEDLVADGWTDITRKLLSKMLSTTPAELSPEAIARTVELADFEKMEEVRARVDASVRDPATAAKLKPWYRQFCKRPCFHDEYLPTFNRPNVTLVDTDGRGVERVTPRGVVANGREIALDCLIFATGFEVGTDYSRRSGFPVVGEGGRTLSEKWRDGIRTLHGIHIHGFPNCFMMSIAQSAFTVNFPYIIDLQAKHIGYVVGAALGRGAKRLEASAEAEQAWVDAVLAKARSTLEFAQNCTPGYYNNEGQPSERSRQDGFYMGAPTEFEELLDAWRREGTLAGLTLS